MCLWTQHDCKPAQYIKCFLCSGVHATEASLSLTLYTHSCPPWAEAFHPSFRYTIAVSVRSGAVPEASACLAAEHFTKFEFLAYQGMDLHTPQYHE